MTKRTFLQLTATTLFALFFTACGISTASQEDEVRSAFDKLISTSKSAKSNEDIKPLSLVGENALLIMGTELTKKSAEVKAQNVQIAHNDHKYDHKREKGGSDFDVAYVQFAIDKYVNSGEFVFIKKDGKWLLAGYSIPAF